MRPFQTQRRFLQGSRSASKPPATAAAAREHDEEYDRSYEETNPAVQAGSSGFRPAFGSRPAFGGSSTSGSSSFSSGPAFGNGRIELTDEERAARDMINKVAEETEKPKPRRLVDVFPAPGPETTRAGRPVPISFSAKRQERPIEAQRKQQEPRRNAPLIKRVPSGATGDKTWSIPKPDLVGTQESTEGDFGSRAESWSHLKRRGKHPENHAGPDGQHTRNEATRHDGPTKIAQYTPLGHRPVYHRSHQAQTSHAAMPRTSSTGEWKPKAFGLPSRKPETAPEAPAKDESRRYDTTATTSEVVDRGTEPYQPKSRHDSPKEENYRRHRDAYAAEESKPSYRQEKPVKGRDKEKTRRRQQFVQEWDEDDNAASAAAAKKELKAQRKREKAAKKAAAPTPILLPEYISVSNLATALKVRVEDFVLKMEELGFEEMGYDHILNGENAGLIAMEYNYEPIIDKSESEDLKAQPLPTDLSSIPPRPPVVTIMGHVDHGKTTLLDFLRKSSVAAGEHGGITQHIGAFSVAMPSGRTVTFLDTPGHAAFLSMRQRGANVTDIVILVVAADDSVKPQTIEAINHAKSAKVPMIVAINKVDKEGANVERVKQDLARHDVEIEDFGGETQVVCVSGKTGQGIDELEEAIVTLSEIIDMKAPNDGLAEGWVLEASVKSMGKVATVLVRRGTMRPGDFVVAGKTWARVRCLRNEAGVEVSEAAPGTPVQVDGWKELPSAGDEVLQAPTENKAKSVIEYRLEKEERDKLARDMQAINEARKAEQEKREREEQDAMLNNLGFDEDAAPAVVEKQTGPKQIYFIVKGDVSGSVEAVVDSISSIGNGEVQPQILRSAVGQLAEFDVEHAAAAGGYLINFNTTVDPNISRLAEQAKVKIIDHNVIYRLVDDVKAAMSEHLPPIITQRVLGEAEVAQVFDITVKGRQQKAIAGCKVRNGVVGKNVKVRVLRDGEKIFDGKFTTQSCLGSK